MWPPVEIIVSSGTATIARIQGRTNPSTAWPITGMREDAVWATGCSLMPASDAFSAVDDSTICSRRMASEDSMQASMKRPPTATTRMMRRRDLGSSSSLGKKLVIPSISIANTPAAISISTTTSAATVETGMPAMRLPEGTSSLIGSAIRLKFTNAPPIATAITSSETTKSCVAFQPRARVAFSSAARTLSYDVMKPSMRLVASRAPETARATSAAIFCISFHAGAIAERILCLFAVASRNSCSAFFSPAIADFWISSSTFFTMPSGVGGIFATAATASVQPGAAGAAVPHSWKSASIFVTTSSSLRCRSG